MDIILDSNQYLADVKMEGIRFQSLLDYLRKTGSSLVIPRLVRDEVLARYSERLEVQFGRAVADLRSLRKEVFQSEVPTLHELNIVEEVSRLEQRLKHPREDLSSTLQENYDGISLEEVAMRGITRRKPANRECA